MAAQSQMLDAVLACLRRGWAVLPVWWVRADGSCACGSDHKDRERDIGKHPLGALVPAGVKDATKDEATVRLWWGRFPDASIGVTTGAPSGFDVLDVDGDAGRETVARWEKEHRPLPETVEQISGSGGRHVLLLYTPGLSNRVGFAAGVDWRTTGGYIVVEPSTHHSGRCYTWDAAHHADEMQVRQCPTWLVARVAGAQQPTPSAAPASLPPQPAHVVERARTYLAKIEGAVSGQKGHNRTFRAACTVVQRFALPLDQAMVLMREWNATCQPPWREKELQHKVQDALRAPGPTGDLLGAQRHTATTGHGASSADAPFQRGDHAELADRLLDGLSPNRALLVHDEGRIHVYSEAHGLWMPQDPPALRTRVKGFAGIPVAPNDKPLKIKLQDTQGAVALAGDVVHRQGFFGDAPLGIAFANVFVALVDSVLRPLPHAPEHRARWAYPFEYSAAKPCPRFETFLDQTFEGESDVRERKACIQEFAGASILGLAPRYQKALVCVGPGSNGKSVLLSVLSQLVPPGTLASIAPQTWTSEYRVAMLAGKLLNIVNELPELELFDTEVVKCIISGDPTTARHIREAPFRFASRAGHVVSANRLPRTADATHGFWRRFLVLTFNNIVAEDNQDPDLADRIVAEELADIVRWALAGAVRLLQQKHYTTPQSSLRALEEWRQDADPVRLFAGECLRSIEADEKGTPAKSAYATFRHWVKENGYPSMAKNKFGSRLRGMGFKPVHKEGGAVYPFALGGGGKSLFDGAEASDAGIDTTEQDHEVAEREALQWERDQ